MSSRIPLTLMIAVVSMAAAVSADDWPQWRGADRLAVWHETGIVEELPAELEVAGSGYAPCRIHQRGLDTVSRVIHGLTRRTRTRGLYPHPSIRCYIQPDS